MSDYRKKVNFLSGHSPTSPGSFPSSTATLPFVSSNSESSTNPGNRNSVRAATPTKPPTSSRNIPASTTQASQSLQHPSMRGPQNTRTDVPSSSSSNVSNLVPPTGAYPMTGLGYTPNMAYGYGYGMMNPYYHSTMDPLYFIHQINYYILSIGRFFDLIGIGSQAFLEILQSFLTLLKSLEMKLRTSSFRHWLQRKSKRSKLLRFCFVMISMMISFHLSRWIKYYLQSFLGLQTSKPSLLPSLSTSQSFEEEALNR